MSASVKKTTRNQLPPGPGRPKGVPNKTTTLLKEAILEAAETAGGKDGLVGYLVTLAKGEPVAFSSLLGKVLPMQVTGAEGDALQIQVITGVPRADD